MCGLFDPSGHVESGPSGSYRRVMKPSMRPRGGRRRKPLVSKPRQVAAAEHQGGKAKTFRDKRWSLEDLSKQPAPICSRSSVG